MTFGLTYEMRRPQPEGNAVIDNNMGFDIRTRRQSAGTVPAPVNADRIVPEFITKVTSWRSMPPASDRH